MLSAAVLAAVVLGSISNVVQGRPAVICPIDNMNQILELSYPLSADSPTFPSNKAFNLTVVSRGLFGKDNLWLESNNYDMPDHIGTHIDAPSHLRFNEGGLSIHQLRPYKLFGPVVRIDITEKTAKDRDAALYIRDIYHHEELHGRIPDGAFVVLYTGWGKKVKDRGDYYGKAALADRSNHNATDLHFPGFSGSAAEFLVENRSPVGVGTDGPSLDPGASQDKLAHKQFLTKGVWGVENMANVDKLPAKGTMAYVMPFKVYKAGGAPARVVAFRDCKVGAHTSSAANNVGLPILLLLALLAVSYLN